MNPEFCVLISVYDSVQQVIAKHAVTFNPNELEFDYDDAMSYFKEPENQTQWQNMLPDGAKECPVLDVESICGHETYQPIH